MYNESQLRRKAYKVGYRLNKGFQHFLGKGYPVAFREVGYNVIDIDTSCIVCGNNDVYDHLFSLDDVEEFLREVYKANDMKF